MNKEQGNEIMNVLMNEWRRKKWNNECFNEWMKNKEMK
mgnify:CR=1 FL=1